MGSALLRRRTREEQDYTREQRAELHRQLTLIQGQTDQLLNLRLLEEIDPDTFAAKNTELRDRAARLKLQADALDRGHDENADIAIKAFELSQSLTEQMAYGGLCRQAANSRNRLFELATRRRNSNPHNEKALRRSRRRASYPTKLGNKDLNLD